eukprot:scaffold840_cov344-Pavlova_lutheri.AAC.91
MCLSRGGIRGSLDATRGRPSGLLPRHPRSRVATGRSEGAVRRDVPVATFGDGGNAGGRPRTVAFWIRWRLRTITTTWIQMVGCHVLAWTCGSAHVRIHQAAPRIPGEAVDRRVEASLDERTWRVDGWSVSDGTSRAKRWRACDGMMQARQLRFARTVGRSAPSKGSVGRGQARLQSHLEKSNAGP